MSSPLPLPRTGVLDVDAVTRLREVYAIYEDFDTEHGDWIVQLLADVFVKMTRCQATDFGLVLDIVRAERRAGIKLSTGRLQRERRNVELLRR